MTARQIRHSAFRPRAIALLPLLFLALLAHASFAAAPVLNSAVSRMIQGSGTFDIQLPLTRGSGVECRLLPTDGITVVLSFDQPVTGGSASSNVGAAGAPTFNNNQMTVVITGVGDIQTVT